MNFQVTCCELGCDQHGELSCKGNEARQCHALQHLSRFRVLELAKKILESYDIYLKTLSP